MMLVPYILLLAALSLVVGAQRMRAFVAAGALVIVSLLLPIVTPAQAADNFPVKDGAGATRTKAAKDLGAGVLADRGVLVDPTTNTDVRPATKDDQQAVQANAGSDALKVLSIQGTTNGKAVAIDALVRATGTDRGAIIGTTAVALIPSDPLRRGFAIQNQSTSANCYINGQATATADYHSLLIAAGTFYITEPTHVGTGAISIICTAASTSIYARSW